MALGVNWHPLLEIWASLRERDIATYREKDSETEREIEGERERKREREYERKKKELRGVELKEPLTRDILK